MFLDSQVTENRPVVVKGENGWRSDGWGFGVTRFKLEYIEALPPSTGNYIQYPLINHNGKEYAYICITESLCCIAVMNTTLYINYISIKKRRQPCFFKRQHFLLVGRKSPQVIRPYCGAKYAGNS